MNVEVPKSVVYKITCAVARTYSKGNQGLLVEQIILCAWLNELRQLHRNGGAITRKVNNVVSNSNQLGQQRRFLWHIAIDPLILTLTN